MLIPIMQEKLPVDKFISSYEAEKDNITKIVYKPSDDWMDIEGGGFVVDYDIAVLREHEYSYK